MPGVHYVLDGRELAAATQPLLAGLDTPNVPRRPLAVEVARYAGEWVAAVVADSRALAEDAAELVRVDYEPLPFVLDGEAAYAPGSPIVHADHGSNVLLDRTFVWGEVEKDFAESPHRLSLRVKWGRSSTVPVETFGVLASWDPWREILDVFASVQMPRFPDQVALALKLPGSSVRVHNDVDVGGSYGVKRGIKHAVLIGLPLAPARLPGAADRGPAGEHARRRRPWSRAQFRCRGRLRRRRRDPLDEDARARQCRRLCRPLAVPARQAHRRDRRARIASRACSTAPSP